MNAPLGRPAAVIFDLGNTLIHYERRENWPEKERESIGHIYSLIASHSATISDGLNEKAFYTQMESAILAAETEKKKTLQEIPIQRIFSNAFTALNLTVAVPEKQLMDAFYHPIVRDARRIDGAVETLEAIKKTDIPLAIVSNVALGFPAGYFIDDMKRHGIHKYFDTLIFSSDIGCVKPHQSLFTAALDALGTTAAETVFIGDNPVADIVGAQALGMRTVMKTPTYIPADGVSPDFTIAKLTELIDLLGV